VEDKLQVTADLEDTLVGEIQAAEQDLRLLFEVVGKPPVRSEKEYKNDLKQYRTFRTASPECAHLDTD
jgi:hypothetical protein